MCLESAQIDSYPNLSEDWEPKSYHVVIRAKVYRQVHIIFPLSLSVYLHPTAHNHTCCSLPRTFRAIASAFVSFRVRIAEFVSLSKSGCWLGRVRVQCVCFPPLVLVFSHLFPPHTCCSSTCCAHVFWIFHRPHLSFVSTQIFCGYFLCAPKSKIIRKKEKSNFQKKTAQQEGKREG